MLLAMHRTLIATLLTAMTAALPAQSPWLPELTADDWRHRNAAALHLCAEARQLDATTRQELWDLAADREPYPWAALPTEKTKGMRLLDGKALWALTPIPNPDDLVPGSANDLVVPYTPQALALLVLLQVEREPDPAEIALAVELATRAIDPAEFALACRICAKFGAPAQDAVESFLRRHANAADHFPSLHAGARVLARLGPLGHDALRRLIPPGRDSPVRRAALLALAELAAADAAQFLPDVATILRQEADLADVAFGTLLAQDDGQATSTALAVLAEGLRSTTAEQRQRCAAALTYWPASGAARQAADTMLAEFQATCSDQEFGMLLGARQSRPAGPIPAAVRQRMLALANGPANAQDQRAQARLAEAALRDDACLLAALDQLDASLPWLGRHLFGNRRGLSSDGPLVDALLVELAAELRTRPNDDRVATFRRWQDPAQLCAEPAVHRALQRELAAAEAPRIDAAGWFVAQHAPQLAAFAPSLAAMRRRTPPASSAVWHAWARLHPAELPAAIGSSPTMHYNTYALAALPQTSDLETRQHLLAISRDPEVAPRIRRRATMWLTTFGAPAVASLLELLTDGDAIQARWALHGLRHAANDLQRESATADALATTLRTNLQRLAGSNRGLELAAALAALDRLQPADLEPVVPWFDQLPREQRWRSLVSGQGTDLDIREMTDAWTVESLFAAIERVGATPAVFEFLARRGDLGLRGVVLPPDEYHVRAIRQLLGKLTRQR
jgi:hypothetical protein